ALLSTLPPPPPSTRFPYTTLFRSSPRATLARLRGRERGGGRTRDLGGCVGGRAGARSRRAPRPGRRGHRLLRPDGRGEILHRGRSEEHTSELQSRFDLVCRLLLEK